MFITIDSRSALFSGRSHNAESIFVQSEQSSESNRPLQKQLTLMIGSESTLFSEERSATGHHTGKRLPIGPPTVQFVKISSDMV